MTDNQKLIAAIAAGLLMMAKGCNPQPEPPAPVAIVAKSFDDYRELMGDVWTEGASKSFSTGTASGRAGSIVGPSATSGRAA